MVKLNGVSQNSDAAEISGALVRFKSKLLAHQEATNARLELMQTSLRTDLATSLADFRTSLMDELKSLVAGGNSTRRAPETVPPDGVVRFGSVTSPVLASKGSSPREESASSTHTRSEGPPLLQLNSGGNSSHTLPPKSLTDDVGSMSFAIGLDNVNVCVDEKRSLVMMVLDSGNGKELSEHEGFGVKLDGVQGPYSGEWHALKVFDKTPRSDGFCNAGRRVAALTSIRDKGGGLAYFQPLEDVMGVNKGELGVSKEKGQWRGFDSSSSVDFVQRSVAGSHYGSIQPLFGQTVAVGYPNSPFVPKPQSTVPSNQNPFSMAYSGPSQASITIFSTSKPNQQSHTASVFNSTTRPHGHVYVKNEQKSFDMMVMDRGTYDKVFSMTPDEKNRTCICRWLLYWLYLCHCKEKVSTGTLNACLNGDIDCLARKNKMVQVSLFHAHTLEKLILLLADELETIRHQFLLHNSADAMFVGKDGNFISLKSKLGLVCVVEDMSLELALVEFLKHILSQGLVYLPEEIFALTFAKPPPTVTLFVGLKRAFWLCQAALTYVGIYARIFPGGFSYDHEESSGALRRLQYSLLLIYFQYREHMLDHDISYIVLQFFNVLHQANSELSSLSTLQQSLPQTLSLQVMLEVGNDCQIDLVADQDICARGSFPLPFDEATELYKGMDTNAINQLHSTFLLNWLVHPPHDLGRWSAAINLALTSGCLLVIDRKPYCDYIARPFQVMCLSQTTLVKGAGVGLGFSTLMSEEGLIIDLEALINTATNLNFNDAANKMIAQILAFSMCTVQSFMGRPECKGSLTSILVDEAMHICDHINNLFGVLLNFHHYGCLADLVGRAGMHLMRQEYNPACQLTISTSYLPRVQFWGARPDQVSWIVTLNSSTSMGNLEETATRHYLMGDTYLGDALGDAAKRQAQLLNDVVQAAQAWLLSLLLSIMQVISTIAAASAQFTSGIYRHFYASPGLLQPNTIPEGAWKYISLDLIEGLPSSVAAAVVQRFYGPLQVEQKIGTVAFKLKLPPSSTVHPVFHVSLLKGKIGNAPVAAVHLPLEEADDSLQRFPDFKVTA